LAEPGEALTWQAVAGPKKTILVIEDEPHIVLGLKDSLEFEGFAVITTGKGREGVALARSESPDAIVLDLMLPDLNGYAVCEEIRRSNTIIPILMLTARSQETDKIRGLDAGADDYVTKPFSVNELIARLRAIFRRAARGGPVPDVVTLGDAQVNFASHSLTRGGTQEQLSFYEVELLRLLYERAGQPVARDEILQKIWGLEAGPTNRTVDNFIVKLRKKIEKAPEKPQLILTVYGFGYKLAMGCGGGGLGASPGCNANAKRERERERGDEVRAAGRAPALAPRRPPRGAPTTDTARSLSAPAPRQKSRESTSRPRAPRARTEKR